MVNTERTRELGLPDVIVINDYEDVFRIENNPEADECLYCGSANITVHGNEERNLLDVIESKVIKPVVDLEFRVKRFKCLTGCSETFYKYISFAEPSLKHTCRLERYIFRRCLSESVSDIANSIDHMSMASFESFDVEKIAIDPFSAITGDGDPYSYIEAILFSLSC